MTTREIITERALGKYGGRERTRGALRFRSVTRRREERGGQSHFQGGQSCHRLMECNRTLASHRLALSPSFSFPSRLFPFCHPVFARLLVCLRRIRRLFSLSTRFVLVARNTRAIVVAPERKRERERGRGRREKERAWLRSLVAILRDALLPPHLFPPLLFLYMPMYLKLDSWRAVKKSCDAKGSTCASIRRGGCLLSTHLATTLIKCADVMINCSDDPSYFTILSCGNNLFPLLKKKGGKKEIRFLSFVWKCKECT